MNSLQTVFIVVLFVSISATVDVALGEDSGGMDYNWDAIQEHMKNYLTEEDEYATSRDGWAEIHKRQQLKKQATDKTCQFTFTDEEIKDNVFRNPRAKFFVTADKTGDSEVYDLKSPAYKRGCHNLKKYEGKIKSVDTLGTCVRLFSSYYCTEWSQAMYPGSTYIPDAKLNGVLSVGPCVSNEFDHSTVVRSSSSAQLEKLRSALESFANVPDLIHDSRTLPNYTKVEMISNPVQEYLLGPGNRVEALRGYIYSRHVKSPESADNARVAGSKQSFYSKLALEGGDEPGFAFPLELGGPADQFYNVFPQNRKQAGNFKGKIVPLLKQMLEDNPSHLWWSVSFIYKNSTTTRPSGLWYRGNPNTNAIEHIFYGYVPNSE